MKHFLDCVADDEEPLETAEDGRAVLEIMFACYESAATGRRIDFPYTPSDPTSPVAVWLAARKSD